MAITVEEKFGRVLSDRSAELTYIVRGTDDDADARGALLSNSPLSHDDLKRDDAEVEEISNSVWLGVVRYARPEQTSEPPETGDSVFSFDTGGGTQHITQSLSTVNRYAPSGETPPDFRGAIGVTEDAVEGVDITVPVYQFSETHYLSASTVDTAYRGNLFWLTGKVNNAGFRGMAAGECLFLGAQGSQRGVGEDWEIAFRFAGSPNITGLTIGDITGISKLGWEYLWVRYEDVEDLNALTLVKRPTSVHIEQVYDYADFSLLGI